MSNSTIGEVCDRFSSGKNIAASKITSVGKYPVFGGNGLRGYTDSYNFDGECAIIGRQGAYCGNVRYFYGKAYMTEHAIVACANNNNSTGYLAYKLSLMNLQQYQGQSAQPGLSVNTLSKVRIDMPEKDVQIKIFDTLKIIDDKIQINNNVNAELEAMAKTIYNYWFLQFEFPNEEGKPYKSSGGKMIWNEELKREIPEGWENKKLGDIFEFIKGKTPDKLFQMDKKEYVSYLTIEVVNGNGLQYCKKDSMIMTNGEVLMVMDGAASSEVYVGNTGAIGSTFCKLQILENYLENNFLYLVMKSLENIFKKVNTGSTVPHANKKYICNFHIAMPIDKKIRERMQGDLNLFLEQILEHKKENNELISLRNFLLPLLMNGQVGF